MLVPPSFGEVRPAVIDVPPSGERRPAVILVPPNGLARPGRAILVPPSGLALPVGAGAGASPSEAGASSAAAFRRSRAAAAFGRVIFYVLPPRRRVSVVFAPQRFTAPRHLGLFSAPKSFQAQARWRGHCTNASGAEPSRFYGLQRVTKLGTAPSFLVSYTPLDNPQRLRGAAENQLLPHLEVKRDTPNAVCRRLPRCHRL